MRITTVTLAFCPSVQLAHCLIKYRQATFPNDCERHYIVAGHYPKNYERNLAEQKLLTEAYGGQWIDPGSDVGAAPRFNFFFNLIANTLTNDDCIITMDPDSSSNDSHWHFKLATILKLLPQCAFVSLNNEAIEANIKAGRLTGTGLKLPDAPHLEAFLPDHPDMINITAWRASFLKDVGGLRQELPYYGQVELPMFAEAKKRGMYGCYLKNVMEAPDGRLYEDPDYRAWKMDHVSGKFHGSFKEWLLK